MRVMPSSTARISTRLAPGRSSGSPHTPGPHRRMAPNPRRFTVVSPPRVGADLNCSESEGVRLGYRRQMARARWKAGLGALPAGKVTGTNREVEAVVAASFAARTAASSLQVDFRQHGHAPWCALTLNYRGQSPISGQCVRRLAHQILRLIAELRPQPPPALA